MLLETLPQRPLTQREVIGCLNRRSGSVHVALHVAAAQGLQAAADLLGCRIARISLAGHTLDYIDVGLWLGEPYAETVCVEDGGDPYVDTVGDWSAQVLSADEG